LSFCGSKLNHLGKQFSVYSTTSLYGSTNSH
ncbi:unnamed protein product, partial [Rotaria magnacalcarata]